MVQVPHFDIAYFDAKLSEAEAAGLSAQEQKDLKASKYGRPLQTVFVPSGEKARKIALDSVVASWKGPNTMAEAKAQGVKIPAECKGHLERNFQQEWEAKGLAVDWDA